MIVKLETTRKFVMSDIRGCFDEFEKLIETIKLTTNDELFITGNIIGGETNQNLRLLSRISKMMNDGYNIFAIMGKNEKVFLKAIDEFETIDEVIDYVDNTANSDDFVEGLVEISSVLVEYYKKNERTKNAIRHHLDVYINGNLHYGNYLFVSDTDYNKLEKLRDERDLVLVFGQTPVSKITGENNIYINNKEIGMNCGIYEDGGNLGCLELETMKEFYVTAED